MASEDPFQTRLRPHFKRIVETLKVTEILDELYAKHLVEQREYVSLRNANQSDECRARTLLTEILPKHANKKETFEKFVSILKNNFRQKELANLLEESPAPNPGSERSHTNMPESSPTTEVSKLIVIPQTGQRV